jgi:hypothetical protein
MTAYDDVISDPRFETEIIPRLEELGFPFHDEPDLHILHHVHHFGSGGYPGIRWRK